MAGCSGRCQQEGLSGRGPVRSAPGRDLGEAGQAPARADGIAHLLPALTVTYKVPVGEHDRVRDGPSALKVTSTSLVLAGSGSDCQRRLTSQLKQTRWGRVVGEHPGPAALNMEDYAHLCIIARIGDVRSSA